MSAWSWIKGAASDVGDVFDDVAEEIPMVGEWFGSDQRQADKEMSAQQRKLWEEIARLEGYMPTAEQLTPEYSTPTYETLGDSAVAGVQADPELVAAQREALGQMQEVYRGGGMTSADRDRLLMGQRQQGEFMRGQREAGLQNAAERGMGGGGAGLASMMAGQQDSAQALANQNAQMNIAAQQRALQAMQAAGGMAGQMRSQGFGEGVTRGTAADRFRMYNTDTRNRQADRTADIGNRRADRATDAQRDIYGMRERQSALRAGQYQRQYDEAERRKREANESQAGQAEAIGKILGA